ELAEPEGDRAAGVRVALGGRGPPSGKAVERGQCLVGLVRGSLDVDLVQDVRHGVAPRSVLRKCTSSNATCVPEVVLARRVVGVTSASGFRQARSLGRVISWR